MNTEERWQKQLDDRYKKPYAKVEWTVEDVWELNPKWAEEFTKEQAKKLLEDNESKIQAIATKYGKRIIYSLLPCNKEKFYIVYDKKTNVVVGTFHGSMKAHGFAEAHGNNIVCINKTNPINKKKLKNLIW